MKVKAFPVFSVVSTWDVLQELPPSCLARGEGWAVLSTGAEGKSCSMCDFGKLAVVFVLNVANSLSFLSRCRMVT